MVVETLVGMAEQYNSGKSKDVKALVGRAERKTVLAGKKICKAAIEIDRIGSIRRPTQRR